jgi:hypothetical protein
MNEIQIPETFDIERPLVPLLDDVETEAEGGQEPAGIRRPLVRLTDIIPSESHDKQDKHRYSGGFRRMVQDPAWKAAGQCPEFVESIRSAYASTSHLKKPEHRQDIIEQGTAEALHLYVKCPCGNIRQTCPACVVNVNGEPPAKTLALPYSVAGLKKFTVRICEKLKKRDRHRVFTSKQQSRVVDTSTAGHPDYDGDYTVDDRPDVLEGDIRCSAGRPSWNAAQRAEDDLIAWIDADRGYVDLANGPLRRFLANTFTKDEVTRFMQKGDGYADLLAIFRQRRGMYK